MNNYEQAVNELAPCGNDCSRCASYVDSKIVHLSKELNENLINFENMAKKLKDLMPIFNYYKEFSDILTHFSNGNCEGCRFTDKPKCQCSINSCHKTQNADFCFECSSFPCTPTTYNESLIEIWKNNNNKIKTYGVENFYIEQKNKPRY